MIKKELSQEYKVVSPVIIGDVCLHWTSLDNRRRLRFKGLLLLITGVILAVSFVLFNWLTVWCVWWHLLIAVSAGAFLTVLGAGDIRKSRDPYWITVGKEGFVRYSVSVERKELYSPVYYLYKDMTDLYFPVTKWYRNDTYQNTEYRFKIFNSTKVVYEERGTYFNGSDHEFFYLLAIEDAWSQYLLKRMNGDLQSNGFAVFGVSEMRFLKHENKTVEIGQGYLKYDSQICRREEILEYGIVEGILVIKLEDSKVEINVNEMLNRKVFFTLQDVFKLIGTFKYECIRKIDNLPDFINDDDIEEPKGNGKR